MSSDYCVLILTHGRPDNVITYHTLRRKHYTGPIFLVVDDKDEKLPEYKSIYGDEVIVFSKDDYKAPNYDLFDNFDNEKCIIFARNACFDIAHKLGFKYFLQLDDDYSDFSFRFDHQGDYCPKTIYNLDAVFKAYWDYYKEAPFYSLCLAQGGDYIGGKDSGFAKITSKRKVMNSFFCSTGRPFKFIGRINEDVNTYTTLATCGALFLTPSLVSLSQEITQSNEGGMSGAYTNFGTYVKSAYSIICCPSAVTISQMGNKNMRLHHNIKWNNVAPKIMREMSHA